MPYFSYVSQSLLSTPLTCSVWVSPVQLLLRARSQFRFPSPSLPPLSSRYHPLPPYNLLFHDPGKGIVVSWQQSLEVRCFYKIAYPVFVILPPATSLLSWFLPISCCFLSPPSRLLVVFPPSRLFEISGFSPSCSRLPEVLPPTTILPFIIPSHVFARLLPFWDLAMKMQSHTYKRTTKRRNETMGVWQKRPRALFSKIPLVRLELAADSPSHRLMRTWMATRIEREKEIDR